MYFPYLRGKQFELEALLGVSKTVYRNTLPIVEPVNKTSGRYYSKLAQEGIPFILIMNPQLPPDGRLPVSAVQTSIVDSTLSKHPALTLAFIIDQHFTVAELQAFLISNPTRDKAVIFRHNPIPPNLSSINALLKTHTAAYIIFDDKRTFTSTRTVLQWHPRKVLITDGFQRQDRNYDYPPMSAFDSNISTWRVDGWAGIGDYLTIGDFYREGGGQPFVVTLHLTIAKPTGLEMHHFSSTLNATIKGGAGPKFREACKLLVNSPHVRGLSSSGLMQYQYWDATAHSAQLGAAKKASLQHHIELLSGSL